MPDYAQIQAIVQTIQQVVTPTEAVQKLLHWLSDYHGPAAIGLTNPAHDHLDIFTGPQPAIAAVVIDWLHDQQHWHQWRDPCWIDASDVPGPALIVPLRYGDRIYGVLWLDSPTSPGEQIVLLAHTLTARLHHLYEQDGLSALLSDSHVLTQQLQHTPHQIQDILFVLTRLTCRYFSYDSAQAYLRQPDADDLQCLAVYPGADNGAALPLAALQFRWPDDFPAAPIIHNDTQRDGRLGFPDRVGSVGAESVVFLEANGLTLGCVCLQTTRTQAFNASAVANVQEIMRNLAVMIHNTWLAADIRELAQKLASLNEIAVLINTTPRLEDLSRRVYEAVDQLESPDIFQFSIFEQDRQLMRIDLYRQDHHLHLNLPYAPERDLLSQMIARATPIFWQTAAERDMIGTYFTLGADQPASFLGVPMVAKGRVLGAISLQSDHNHAFTENSLHLMITFANAVAVAVENAEILSQAERRVQELGAINELTLMLAGQRERDGLWQPLAQQIAVLFETSTLVVGLYDAQTGNLTFPLVVDESGSIQPPDAHVPLLSLHEALIKHGVPLHFHDLPAEHDRLTALGLAADSFSNDELTGWPLRSWLSVPLRSRNNEILGLLSVHNVLADNFTDADLSLLLTIAAQLSLTLENAQLLEAEQARRRLANTLMTVSRDVSSTLQYDEVLERILEQMQRVVPYDSATIMLLTEQTTTHNSLMITALQGIDPQARGREIRCALEHPMSRALASRQPVVMKNAQEHPDWLNLNILSKEPMVRGWIGVPLLVEDKPIGMITLDKSEADFYSQQDASNAFAVARQVAVAVQNAQMHAKSRATLHALQLRNQRLAAIHRISSMVNATLDRDDILNMTARQLTDIFQVDYCGIVLLAAADHESQRVVDYPEAGAHGLRLLVKKPKIHDQLAAGAVIAIDDVAASELDGGIRAAWQRLGIVSVLVAPLIAHKRLLGAIGLHSMADRQAFGVWEQDTLLMITRQLSLAIVNADLYEEALVANRLQGEFLASISHELRTPLNAIIGYSEMLRDELYGPINEDQRDRLTRVYVGGKQLLELISDVLDLSKIEAGQMPLSLTSVQISEQVAEALTPLTYLAEKKGLELNTNIASNLGEVQADPQRVRQVLTNLLDNAIKFTHHGRVTITARPVVVRKRAIMDEPWKLPTHLFVPDGKWVALRVADTGIGIAPTDQTYIFDAFRQVDGSAMKEYPGTGLGLAISYQIVTMHEGYMWVESEPGVGSTFTVLLPYDPLNPISETAEMEAFDADKQLILVLDDDTEDIQLAKDCLNNQDFHVLGMTNPHRALDLAQQLVPAVMLVDVLMPQRNGWDVLKEVRDNPLTAHIPVILWSVTDSHGFHQELGAVDYLIKPVARDTLIEAVEQAINRH